MRIYFISRKDGGVTVMYIYSDNTVEEEIQKWHPDDQANVESIIEGSEDKVLPQDEFRNSWKLQDTDIVYDLEKAKSLQLERIRNVRKELFVQYDGLQMRAMDLEDAETLAQIKTVKQELRDSTEPLKSLEPTSVEDIKAATPDLTQYAVQGEKIDAI